MSSTFGERKRPYCFSLTPKLWESLRDYARRNGHHNVSAALRSLIETGTGEEIDAPRKRPQQQSTVSNLNSGEGGR